MLKYMPIYGSILLTVIIVWIMASTIIGNRRKIGRSLAGAGPNNPDGDRSTCCNSYMKPLGWTEEGWVALCRSCGAWQYLGEDHDNPPAGFNEDGSPKLGWNANGSECGVMPEQRLHRPLDADEITEVTSDYYPVKKARAAAHIAMAFGDEGEPLANPPAPNIGGEGKPDYAGPHYLVEHDRFVPYDVLRDPVPGAAVHIVGNAACVGPLEVERGEDHAEPDDHDSSRA